MWFAGTVEPSYNATLTVYGNFVSVTELNPQSMPLDFLLFKINLQPYWTYIFRWAAAESGEDQLEWLMDSNVPRNLSCRQHRLFSLKVESDQILYKSYHQIW